MVSSYYHTETDQDFQGKHIQEQKENSQQKKPKSRKDNKTARQIQRLKKGTKGDWGQNEGTQALE